MTGIWPHLSSGDGVCALLILRAPGANIPQGNDFDELEKAFWAENICFSGMSHRIFTTEQAAGLRRTVVWAGAGVMSLGARCLVIIVMISVH